MARIACPDFIDRVEESRALAAGLDRAAAGEAPTVLVGGEAGIGKSRLVGELVALAAARGARVLSGGCAPFGSSAAPFAPLVEALRQLGRDESAELLVTAPALSWLLPELAPAVEHERFESGQGLVFESLLAALSALAARPPLVVVLEDLHWADRSTLELLALRVQSAARPAACSSRRTAATSSVPAIRCGCCSPSWPAAAARSAWSWRRSGRPSSSRS